MHAMKLRVHALPAARLRSRAAHVGPCYWSEGHHNNVEVTAGKASHNASNARGITAGRMGRNSSLYNGHFCPNVSLMLITNTIN